MNHWATKLGLLPATLVLAACAVTAPLESDPSTRFDALERRLLEAEALSFAFHITAEGAISVDLRGTYRKTSSDDYRLSAAGDFAGQAIDLSLRTDGDQLLLDNRIEQSSVSRPEYLNEALVIGLTRMGLLHNLARLAGNRPPDHADGGVREWVTVTGLATVPETDRSVSFEIIVADQPSGSASLALDPDGRPILRRQTVRFPSGEMRVTERYSAVAISDPPT
ncbi:MAG: hypothetical protein V2J10_11265 [Wenzhouxiangella sp.]|jgi:hypothetical protein|nr:hypothetical protein [Wenzhouxiangella sp.]